MKQMKYISEPFKINGFRKGNNNINTTVKLNTNDILNVDTDGYLWYWEVCVGHKDVAMFERKLVEI